jgi:hypothetical protein
VGEEAMAMTDDDDLDELLRQGKIEGYLARTANMTDEQLMRRGEAAFERYEARQAEIRAQIMPMAYGLMAALYVYRTAASFEAWRKSSAYADFSEADIAALLKIAEHCQIAEEFLRTTTLVEPQEIWNAIKDRAEPPQRT